MFVYADDTFGLTFTWSGGAYIDIFRIDRDDSPFDCINVWDYETNTPNIARTQEAFEAECKEWIQTNS